MIIYLVSCLFGRAYDNADWKGQYTDTVLPTDRHSTASTCCPRAQTHISPFTGRSTDHPICFRALYIFLATKRPESCFSAMFHTVFRRWERTSAAFLCSYYWRTFMRIIYIYTTRYIASTGVFAQPLFNKYHVYNIYIYSTGCTRLPCV